MNLIIDIGNTNVKVAVFKAGVLIDKEIVGYSQLIDCLKNKNFDKGIVSNVGNQDLEKEVVSLFPFLVSMKSGLDLPIGSTYSSMETIGKDRLANAVGAFVQNPNQNSLVIDAGSCLTFDFIDSNNYYHGGAISPGLSMRFKALNTFTENLPLLTKDAADLVLTGVNTNSSIVSGVVNGMASEIVQTIDKYRSKHPGLTIFMTGGDSGFINSIVEVEKNGIFAVENLTMIGLNAILNYNDK